MFQGIRLHALERSEACLSVSLCIPVADVVISVTRPVFLCNRKQVTLGSADQAGRTMEAILAYRLLPPIIDGQCTKEVELPFKRITPSLSSDP